MNIDINIDGNTDEIAAVIDKLRERPSIWIDKNRLVKSSSIHGTCEGNTQSLHPEGEPGNTEAR